MAVEKDYTGELSLVPLPRTLMEPGIYLEIVTEQSAVLGIANERKASVNANHTDICKFSGPGDTAYITVRQVLREIVIEMTPRVTTKDSSTQPSPPADLKYASLSEDETKVDNKQYPVLVWGKYTYWCR